MGFCIEWGHLITRQPMDKRRDTRTPHSTTGVSPSQKLYQRQIRSRLDFIIPKEEEEKDRTVITEKVRKFEIGDRVAARNYKIGEAKWKFGRIQEKLGQLHYNVSMDSGLNWKRHIDQLRNVGENVSETKNQGNESSWDDEDIDISFRSPVVQENEVEVLETESQNEREDVFLEEEETDVEDFQDALDRSQSHTDSESLETAQLPGPLEFEGRPKRIIKPPNRLNL
ncbi:uncharacterized protein LOC129806684 [Phlebotomus papatasi]|uniref:uncharacterized protein LOC129806684 n=1 Tax=Phlebotomus papatasi TaxID=29031 RepID=UPI0024845EF4|nr:uncharacterized protein LOC129806684 [Phlebotomus papatasi]